MTAKLTIAGLALLATACAEPQWATPVAGQNASPTTISAVQRRLQANHFYVVGPADGINDIGLQAALWYFQQDQNLRTTGQIDRETLRALGLAELAFDAPPAAELTMVGPPRPKAGGGVFHTPLAWQ